MKFSVDNVYLRELLVRYSSLNENPKEKINVRNAIVELLQPCATAIILTYSTHLDWDMSQDVMESLINQVDKWDSNKTKTSKNGKPNDLGFFVACIHNRLRNYLKKQNKQNERETLYDPLNHPWEDVSNWEIPKDIELTKIHHLEDEKLQKAYEYCLDMFLGKTPHTYCGALGLSKKIRGEFGLTYQQTKDVLQLAETTIREFIESVDNG